MVRAVDHTVVQPTVSKGAARKLRRAFLRERLEAEGKTLFHEKSGLTFSAARKNASLQQRVNAQSERNTCCCRVVGFGKLL